MPITAFGFENLPKVISDLRKLPSANDEAMKLVVNDDLNRVFRESQRQVPEDTGALKKSGRLYYAKVAGKIITAAIGYGSKKAWYAHIVHEGVVKYPGRRKLRKKVVPRLITLTFGHGNAKFLEKPFASETAGLDERLAGAMGTAMDRVLGK